MGVKAFFGARCRIQKKWLSSTDGKGVDLVALTVYHTTGAALVTWIQGESKKKDRFNGSKRCVKREY